MTHIDNLLEHFKGLGCIIFADYSYDDPFTEISYDDFLELRSEGEWDCYVLQWDCYVLEGSNRLALLISNWKF